MFSYKVMCLSLDSSWINERTFAWAGIASEKHLAPTILFRCSVRTEEGKNEVLGEFGIQESTRGLNRTAGKTLDRSRVPRIVHDAGQCAGVAGAIAPHWLRHAHATHNPETKKLTVIK